MFADLPVALTNTLAAQHISIDYDLASVPLGHPDVSYLSDHKPLRIDLARPRAHSTPAEALTLSFPPFPSPPVARDEDQLLVEGQVKWYRFDEAGTYDFTLTRGTGTSAGETVTLDTFRVTAERDVNAASLATNEQRHVAGRPRK